MTSRLTLQPVRLVLLALCVALVIPWAVSTETQAQALYGTVTGRVTDATGGAIPGAEVTALNVATNFSQTTLTNDVGTYTLPNLPDGTYNISVSLTGFKNSVNEGVVVAVGTVTRQNVVLQIGEITESITVSSAATVLKTDTTDVSAQIESKEIEDLPLGGFKNYQSLINLVPGATPGGFQNAITDTPGRALTTNVNGTNRNSNNTRIDGAISVNIWLPHHTAYVPPSETIEVVDISTNNFDAEKGFAGGAATTVITKSGTNELHGNLFWLHSNSALNARNFFNYVDADGDGKADPPKGRRNIGGFTIGGPIVKDKLFFFGGFEGTWDRAGTSETGVDLPTADQRAGDFSAFYPEGGIFGNPCPIDPTGEDRCTLIYDPLTGNGDGTGKIPFANNIIPTDRLHPGALTMQNRLPLPNLPGLTQNFEAGESRIMNRFNYDVKGDWYRTDEHRLWGKFSWMDAKVVQNAMFGPGGGDAIGDGGAGDGLTDVVVYGVGHTWTLSPTLLIDGNLGFTDMDQQVITFDLDLGNYGVDTLGIPGTNAAPGQDQACIVDGLNRCGGLPRFTVSGWNQDFGQVDGWMPVWRNENSLTFTQNVSWTQGSHELRFGYDLVKHMLDHWQPEIGDGPRGRIRFSGNTTGVTDDEFSATDQNSWASYLLGTSYQIGKSLQWELMTANEWQHAVYVRDRWQATPKLTLTLGLRYEYFPLMTRDDRKVEVLDIHSTLPCLQQPGEDRTNCFLMTLDNHVKVSKTLFAPRLGFAYRLTDNDVFRMGYGITNSPMPYARPYRGFYPLTVGATFEAQDNFVYDPQYGWDNGMPNFIGPETAPGARIPLPSFVQQRTMPLDKTTRGYIQSWNVMYERKFPADFVVSFGYVGTQTVHQLADNNLNWSPADGGNEGRQLWEYSTNAIEYWDGWLSSNYHSLQVAINRRFSNGLFVKGAYTFSKAINMADDEGWTGLSWDDPELINRNRAVAGYNRPHMLQLATIYDLPFGQDGDDFGSKLIRNWQVNGIFSVNSHTPFTVSGGGGANNCRECTETPDQVKTDVVKLGGVGQGQPYYDPDAFEEVPRIPGVDCTNADCYGSAGRNILYGPTWVNLDFSIFRKFALTEDYTFEFRAEFFNLTNTPHFNNPSGSSTSSSFFEISSTSDDAPERVIRFGLKFIF